MKKNFKILSLFFSIYFLFIADSAYSAVYEIYNFNDLNNYWANSSDSEAHTFNFSNRTITLTADIVMLWQTSWRNLTFSGNNYIIDGNNAVYRGFFYNDPNKKLNFTGNFTMRNFADSVYGPLRVAGNGAELNFANLTAYFIDSKINSITVSNDAIFTVINSILNFTDNEILGSVLEAGGIVTFRDSQINLINNKTVYDGGAMSVLLGGNFTVINSTMNFTNNTAGQNGGAVTIRNDSTIVNFVNSVVNFTGNTANGTISGYGGGAIYFYSGNTTMRFSDSTAYFYNNKANGIDNDIEFYSRSIYNYNLIFEGNVNLTNGIRIRGGSDANILIRKTGAGQVVFAGENSKIENGIFTIEQGSAVFKSVTASSVNTMIVNNGAELSLINNAKNDLIITSTLTINGSLSMDFNGDLNDGDYLFGNSIVLDNLQTLILNVVNSQKVKTAIQLIVVKSNTNWTFNPNTEFIINSNSYSIFHDENSIFITSAPATTWDIFVEEYNTAAGASNVFLNVAITSAFADSEPIGNPNNNNLTIEGNNYKLDSSAVNDLGFTFIGKTINFNDISLEKFQTSGANNGAVVRADNTAAALSGLINFTSNTAFAQGGAIRADNSNFAFTNSTINFTKNYSMSGGAVYAQNSKFDYANSQVNFISNTGGNHGGAIYGDNQIFNFINTAVTFAENTSVFGGAVYGFNRSSFSFINSKVHFTSNSAPSNLGGAVFIDNNSILIFAGSSISFFNNKDISVDNDIAFGGSGKNSLVFDGNVYLLNGIKTGGNISASIIRKTGTGQVIFSGEASIIKSSFSVESGSAVFNTTKSAASILDIQTGAALLLQKDFTGDELFAGDLFLNGIWDIDVNFNSGNGFSDIIISSGNIIIGTGKLNINRLDAVLPSTNSLLIFKYENPIIGLQLKTVGFPNLNYYLYDENKTIYLAIAGAWNRFVSEYTTTTADTIFMTEDSEAAKEANIFEFGNFGKDVLTIAGNNWKLDAGAIAGLGFVLSAGKTRNFNNISFENFLSTNANNGAVINANNAIVNSTGAINFTSNSANSGGALYSNSSTITFLNSNVNFITNTAADLGGAVYADNYSSFTFINLGINFTNNNADSGGAVYVNNYSTFAFLSSFVNSTSNSADSGGAVFVNNNSIFSFMNSIIFFTSNSAQNAGGAIFIDDNSTIKFTDSRISFIDNMSAMTANDIAFGSAGINSLIFETSDTGQSIILTNGIRTSGNLGTSIIRKMGLGQIIFDGDSKIENRFIVEQGSAVFRSAISSISIIEVLDESALILQSGNAQGKFFVGDLIFNANTYLEIGADFGAQMTADMIISSGNISINSLALFINRINMDMSTNSVAIIQYTGASPDIFNISVSSQFYIYDGGNQTIYLALHGVWNSFVNGYKSSGTAPLELSLDTDAKAVNEAIILAIDSPMVTDLIMINGNKNKLDSSNIVDLGFVLDGDKINFKDIGFENFITTETDKNGGVIRAKNSDLSFSGTINFTSNTVRLSSAGAVFSQDSIFTFTRNSAVYFTNNSAGYRGGAVNLENSNFRFLSLQAGFINNSSDDGGAVYALSSNFEFSNSQIDWTDNSADNFGGAIFIDNSSTVLFANSIVNFTGNSAQKGGAVFIDNNSTMKVSDSQITFFNNRAGAIENDIAFGAAGINSLIFETSQAEQSITLTNGLRTSGEDIQTSIIRKTGEGQLIFEGQASIINNRFNIEAGTAIFKSAFSTAAVIDVKSGAELSMISDSLNTLYLSSLTISGMLAIEVNFDLREGDFIYASSISVNSASALNIVNLGKLKTQSVVKIMQAQDEISYQQFSLLSSYYSVYTTDNGKILWLQYSPFVLTDGLNLTSNEQEVYDLIIENDIYMDKFVGTWNVLNNRERKYFLDSLSGSFLVNAMTMGAVFDNSAILALIKEGAIKNRETKFNKKEGMWIIGSYNSLKWSNSKQTLGDFNASGIGVKAGKDIVVFDWGLAGIFGGYENRNMSQSGNLANMDDAGAGIYGGFFIDIFSFNYAAQAAFQNIKTQREVRLENAYKPEAKIETYGIRGSAEIEINFEAQEMGIEYISPFAEYDFAQIENNTVSETGGESLNLTIYKDRYLRETIFGGIKIKPISDGRFSWNGKIYIGQVITGTKANKKISFMESGKMNIQGDEQEEIFYGGSIGIKYEASKKIDINFSFDIRGSENALAYGISAGMKYKFSVIMKKISSEKIKFEKKARAAISEKKKMNIKIDREAAGNIIADKIKTKEEIANQDKEKANEIKNAAKITYKLESALFKNASSELAQDMKIKLKTLADKIKKMDYKKIVIEGHTDSSGNDDKNRSLSIERAKAIYDELLKNGIPAEKMEYMGFGSNVPISSNDTAEGKAKNRRAEIFVL